MKGSDREASSDGALLGAVSSLVLGAFLGAAVSELFGGGVALLTAALWSLAIVFGAVLCFIALDRSRNHSSRIGALTAEVAMLRELIGEPAELKIERFDDSTGEYFRRLEHIIARLTGSDEVLVMTYHARVVEGGVERNKVHATARTSYLDTLLRKASEGVTYRRILSFESTDGQVIVHPEFIRQHTREHCIGMIKLAASRPGAVVVKKAPAILTADIIIINRDFGAISMETW